MKTALAVTLSLVAVASLAVSIRYVSEPAAPPERTATAAPDLPTVPVGQAPRPLPPPGPIAPQVQRGLEWLVAQQGPDGGWGENDGQDTDVANTCIAALALLRAGHTPIEGEYREAVARAVAYVCEHVHSSPDGGLAVQTRQGTIPQRKLGPYVDTFLASLLLAEVDGRMPGEEGAAGVRSALEKVVAKIEAGQQEDGSWNHGGWAPILSTTYASMGLNRARERGVQVDGDRLARARDYTSTTVDVAGGSMATADSAGITLYAASNAVANFAYARGENERELRVAIDNLQRAEVQTGFGSFGGEEFLSYQVTSENLARLGGEDWERWNGAVTARVLGLQNADGSWAGHHCITGRVFCTSGALLTLLADRAS